MDKIIVLPGAFDNVFFVNEADYIAKYFDEVAVVSYFADGRKINDAANKSGLRHHDVKAYPFKALMHADFYRWLFCKSTMMEIKTAVFTQSSAFKNTLYVLYYGMFYVSAKKYIDYEIDISPSCNIYLYSFWLSRGAYAAANYNVGRKGNIVKIISRAHGYDLYEERNSAGYLPFRKFINDNMDEISFISDHGRDYFSHKYEYAKSGSLKSISRMGSFNPDRVLKKIYEKSKVCIASCSSIISVKRIDLIVDVISRIELPVVWLHIGSGELQKSIESYAAEKLSGKEHHFLGKVDNSEILNTYERYDVDFFINMSDSEGIPVSIMEAMSMGIPTIARDVGGISEIVNNETGLLIMDINNRDDLFMQVNVLIRERYECSEKYLSKSEKSIDAWKINYNAEKNLDEFFKGMKET